MHRHSLLAPLLFSCLLTGGCSQENPPSPEGALQTLIALIHDQDASVRKTAVDALGKIGDPRAEPFLIGALGDGHPAVREAAARSVGRLQTVGAEAMAALVSRLEDPDRSVQRAAAQALSAGEGSPSLSSALAGLLVSPDAAVRQTAAHALSVIDVSEPSVIAALGAAAQDSDATVRQWAVAALGESGSVRALPILLDRLRHDPVEAVRVEAAYRAQFVGDESAAMSLDGIAEERSPTVRAWVKKSRSALKTESDFDSEPRPTQPAAPGRSDRYP